MARNYVALPYEYLEELDALNDAEFGRLTRALLKYSMTGEPIALCGNERFYAKRLMKQEDRFKANYDEISDARSEAGKKGAASRWQNNGKNGKAIANDGKNGNTNTNTDTDNNTSPPIGGRSNTRAKRFAPPTLEEVTAYVKERNSKVDPQAFIDFYASKGWLVGKTPMKDWKAACRNAEKWDRWDKPQYADRRKEQNEHGKSGNDASGGGHEEDAGRDWGLASTEL